MKIFKNIIDHQYWFGQNSLIAICIFRIWFMMFVCIESVTRFVASDELFSSQGFHVGSLSAYVLPPIVAKALCLLLIIASLSAAIGFFTRTSMGIVFFLWLYFLLIDQINIGLFERIVLFNLIILLISKSHTRFSIDDLLNIKNKQKRESAAASVIPLRLLQIQFLQVYFFAGLIKLNTNSWVSGETLSQILTLRWATDFGVWFSMMVSPIGFYFLSVFIILYELFAGIGLFIPIVRNYFIIFGVCFHLMAGLMLYAGVINWFYLGGLILLFYNPERINRFVGKVGQRLGYLI